MKANEIQIGDYLYSIIDRYDHTEKKLCRVTGIRIDSDTPLIQCDDTDVWYPIDTYKAVPIVPEILKKNGFERIDGFMSAQYTLKDSQWKVEIEILSNNKLSIEIRNEIAKKDNTGRADLVSFMRDWTPNFYVHELQRALRICGIDKEITL